MQGHLELFMIALYGLGMMLSSRYLIVGKRGMASHQSSTRADILVILFFTTIVLLLVLD